LDDVGHPAVLVACIECDACGRIDKAAHDFHLPAGIVAGMQLFVWIPCEQCCRQAKLRMRRELKPAL